MCEFSKKMGARIKKLREQLDLSQEQLAKLLGKSRVIISHIENGERKVTAEEIINLSQIFNMPATVLLGVEKEIEIVFGKKGETAKTNTSTRINVPQENLKKFKEVLLYILNKVGSKPNIGQSVLYKLLYFSDFNFYEKYEEQLTGATYIKNYYGPTPNEFIKIVEQMEGNELVKIQTEHFQYPQTKYLPLREPDLTKLKAHEIKTINDVLRKLSDMSALEISEYSHHDVPWITTDTGKVIDYESVFYRTAPYSVRVYSEDDIS